jgi:two-component sensor histidine kinase
MNNFQMIASLLHLGASRADPVGSQQMKAAENRIQVLARLHSLLSYTESDNEVNAGQYLGEICMHLESALDRPEAVTIECDADEIPMPTDQVVPLGLIVTELVTNAAKYAYPAPMAGTIRVALAAEPSGWRLTIEDDGAGFDAATQKTKGRLGTTLVRRFVQQIGAELTTESEGGVRHRIIFRAKA